MPVVASCSTSPGSHVERRASDLSGTTVNMHFERASFYDAPFPSDDLILPDGRIAIDGFPNLPAPDTVALIQQMQALVDSGSHGFAEEGAIYFTLDGLTIDGLDGGAPPPSLPDMATSITPAASVMLVGVTRGAPDFLKPYPITARFDPDGGPFGAPNMVTLLPLQGIPLRPREQYAAVITTATGLSPSAEMQAIASGNAPSAMPAAAFAEYHAAIGALGQMGVAPSTIAGMSVFTTDDPTATLGVVLDDMMSRGPPMPDSAFQQTDLFDTYCVYEATLPMPDYQAGDYPYTFDTAGGTWQFDASGKPILQRSEEAGVVITIPRAPMPSGGWPIMHFIRTGGGTDRPLVDRGPEATNGGPPITPGTGPAQWFTMAGMAGAEVDGPHEDLRNLTNDNEDFLMFNVNNIGALRDNVRESAAEYALFAHTLAALQLDVSDCPGTTSPATFDAAHMGLMGHSMGATIAPLSLQAEPMYKIAVLSGAGASWIENVIWKQQPLDVAPLVDLLLRYNDATPPRTITEDDPAATLFQWAAESADPLVYARALLQDPAAGQPPCPILMEQGIVDHYIMPNIANAMSLSLGLDLAGTPLDATNSELTMDGATPLESVLPYSGRSQIALPVMGNFESGVTAVVVQHPGDGIEDGHEVVFQTDPPKREYRCFLQTWVAGQTPLVPLSGALDGGCQ